MAKSTSDAPRARSGRKSTRSVPSATSETIGAASTSATISSGPKENGRSAAPCGRSASSA